MAEHVIKLPDVGEGVAEAELVEWHVKVGDLVREDAVLAAVMTDKATVEIPSPTDGEVVWLGAEIGDTVAVGAPLIRLKDRRRAEGVSPRQRRTRPNRRAARRKRRQPAAWPKGANDYAVAGKACNAPRLRRRRRYQDAPAPSSRQRGEADGRRARAEGEHPRRRTCRPSPGEGGGHRPQAAPGQRTGRPHHP